MNHPIASFGVIASRPIAIASSNSFFVRAFNLRSIAFILLHIFSILGIVFAVVYSIALKKGKEKEPANFEKVFDKVFLYLYYAVVAAMAIVMYIIPVCIKLSL